MSTFVSLEGDSDRYMGLATNFFDLDSTTRSPIDTIDQDISMNHPWTSLANPARTNPFFMSNSHNPFPQTYCIPNNISTDQTAFGEPDLVFSSPATAASLTFAAGPIDPKQQCPPTPFSAFQTGVELSPALTSATQMTFAAADETPTLGSALLSNLSIPTDVDVDGDFDDASPFDVMSMTMPKATLNKKNTRVEIPPERTLQTIDEMIRTASSEETAKELRKQKRLLRNRKAALDSRVRKRQYTNSLERDKDRLEEEVQALRAKLARLHRDATDLSHGLDQAHRDRDAYAQQLRTCHLEQEEMVRSHTLETGLLRKKIQYLSSKMSSQMTAATPIQEEPSHFTDFLDHSGLPMAGFDFLEFDSPLAGISSVMPDSSWPPFQPAIDIPSTAVVVKQKKEETEISSSQSPASGLLWLLLLCGAFVATKSAGNLAPVIPVMPDEVRAASATVLDSIFQDAGMPSLTSSGGSAASSEVAMFVSSVNDALISSNGANAGLLTAPNMAPIKAESDMMETFGVKYIKPCEIEEGEQLFSMTAAQYSAINSPGMTRAAPTRLRSRSPSKRRSLTEALNAMQANRQDAQGMKSGENLLWNSIPAHVIREFRRMVDEDGTATSAMPMRSPMAAMT